MKKLLKFEFHKLKTQKSFYVCTVIMAALLMLTILAAKAVAGADAEDGSAFTTSGTEIMLNGVSSASFTLIAGIFVALFVCEDYEQQTVKNIYSRGYSRIQVYFSKLFTVWFATTVMYVVVVALAFASGAYFFGVGYTGDLWFIAVLAVQYVACMANVGMCFAISSVMRKNGSSIAFVIVAPMLVNIAFGLIDSLLKSDKFSVTSLWLSSFMTDLTAIDIGSGRLAACLSASLVYIAFFVFAGMGINSKNQT